MRRLSAFWQALEAVAGLSLPLGEWTHRLASEMDIVRRYLRATGRLAQSYPCTLPGERGCRRRVVVHGPSDIVAICGVDPRECDSESLSRSEIAIHAVDLPALLRDVSKALGIQYRLDKVPVIESVWRVGLLDLGSQSPLPVYLLLRDSAEAVHHAVAELLGANSDRFALLTPTTKLPDVRTVELLRRRRCFAAALEDLVSAGDAGGLTSSMTLAEWSLRAESPQAATRGPTNCFRRSGNVWTIRFGDVEVQLKDRKGLRYLAILLKNPGREFKPWELLNEAGDLDVSSHPVFASGRSERSFESEGLGVGVPMEGGELPDPMARASCETRLRDLAVELGAAEAINDRGKVEALKEEQEQILQYLLGERGPRSQRYQQTDRAAQALRYSLRKLTRELPVFASHLEIALDQGPRWRYRKELAVSWSFQRP